LEALAVLFFGIAKDADGLLFNGVLSLECLPVSPKIPEGSSDPERKGWEEESEECHNG
jgi:hypothetical protein